MRKIYLIEDHDQALKVWQDNNVKNLDLVHVDAHIDFGFYAARPIEDVIRQAQSLKGLKAGLEQSLNYSHFASDFQRQLNIGNFIYPAMQQGRVRDFYWVIPGGKKEFKESKKIVLRLLKNLVKKDLSGNSAIRTNNGCIKAKIFNRNIFVCNLNSLPFLKEPVLLDIDVDFLVMDSLITSSHTDRIGKRKPWILPHALSGILTQKIKQPRIITIAYSVNGGFTPLKYKYFGDELAYCFDSQRFGKRFRRNQKVAQLFRFFQASSKPQFYRQAIKIDPSYRCADNNYGPLYLASGKLAFAQKEFKKICKADPANAASVMGLGQVALGRKQYRKAKKYFRQALNNSRHKAFTNAGNNAWLGLGQAEFYLKNYAKAEKAFLKYQKIDPLNPDIRYFLGLINEKKRKYQEAVRLYRESVRLGFSDTKALRRLLKLPFKLNVNDGIIKLIKSRLKVLKKED